MYGDINCHKKSKCNLSIDKNSGNDVSKNISPLPSKSSPFTDSINFYSKSTKESLPFVPIKNILYTKKAVLKTSQVPKSKMNFSNTVVACKDFEIQNIVQPENDSCEVEEILFDLSSVQSMANLFSRKKFFFSYLLFPNNKIIDIKLLCLLVPYIFMIFYAV